MSLIEFHPEVAHRSCELCTKYQWDHEKDKPILVAGKPVERPKGTGPPCSYQDQFPNKVMCPKVSPTAGVELNARNAQAYRHYRECKAVGQFPDDPIVRRNAGIIREIEDTAVKVRAESVAGMLQVLTRMA